MQISHVDDCPRVRAYSYADSRFTQDGALKKVFRIVDFNDVAAPYPLLDPDGLMIRAAYDPRELSKYAFDSLGADEVCHEEDLIKAESVPYGAKK